MGFITVDVEYALEASVEDPRSRRELFWDCGWVYVIDGLLST